MKYFLIIILTSFSFVSVKTECIAQSDIIFLLDHSGSIRDSNPANGSWDNWELLKDFCVKIVEQLNISYDGVHVGLITFGNIALKRFSLLDYYQKSDIVNAIRSLPAGTGETNLYEGLVLLRQQFQVQNGGRPELQSIAIILTDGKANINADKTVAEAQAAYLQDGILIYVVGITDQIDLKQILDVSSPPHKQNENYWITPDFRTMSEILNGVQKVTCLPEKFVYEACKEKDLIIALTPPSSHDQWTFLNNFIKSFIQRFLPIGQSGVRLALITYDSGAATIQFGLDKFDKEADVKAALDSLKLSYGGYGNPAYALELASSVLKPIRNVEKNIILFLENTVQNQEVAIISQNLSNSMAARVTAIDILSENSLQDLRKIGTRSSDVIQTLGYNYLQTKLGQLGEIICGSKSGIACPRKADIVMLIDQSTSIVTRGYENWDYVKNFAATIADAFPISPNLTQIGAVFFSSSADVKSIIPLNKYKDSADLKVALLGHNLEGGETNIADGIRKVIPLFEENNGGRKDAPHILIMITDGKANRETDSTLVEADNAKNANITIFTIGITNEIDENQLRSIASKPYETHYFFSSDYQKLNEILQQLIETSCNASQTLPTTTGKTATTPITDSKTTTTTSSTSTSSTTRSSLPTSTTLFTTALLPTSTAPTTTITLGSPYNTTTTSQSIISFVTPSDIAQCFQEIDLVFVLDQSIGNENWNQVKYFVSQIVQYLNISDNGIHVGLVTVGTTSTSRISLTESYQKDAIVQKIDSMQPGTESAINIYNGLVEMRKLFSSSGRPSVTRLAILLLSNQDSTYNSLTQNEAQSAYLKDGIRLYVVGVGNAITDEQLKNISSPPNQAEENYWKLPDFQSLNNILHNLQLVSCNPGKVYYYSCEIMDVAFALPTSPDVSTWNYLKNFIEHFIEGFFSINAAGVRIGFITYNISNTVTHFRLEQYSSESQVMAAIDSLRFEFLNGVNDGNPTNALIAAKALFTPTRNVQKTLILFLDKELSSQEDAFNAASDLTVTLGVRIVTINIGSSNSFTNLRKIATRTQDILQITTYGYLQTAIGQLGDVVCGAQSDTVCPRKADVVLLVDQSTSIVSGNNGYANWDLVKNFAATIADAFPVSETLTRIGVILFSNNALVDSAINLNRYMNNAALKSAILSLELGGGETNIADGIRHVIPMFDQSVGGRSDAPHIMILITDGKANRDTENTLIEAQKAKAANITIFTIGVTNQIDEDQLRSIASSPSNEHYFFSNDFEKLSELLNKVIQKSCVNAVTIPTTTRRPTTTTTATTTTKISTTTTSITSASITIPTTSSSTLTPQITTDDLPSTTVATTSSSTTTTTLGSPYNTTTTATQSVISFIPPSEAIQCLEEIDIVFVLDQSIGNENWNQVKYFVSQIVQYLNISDNGIHVGLVTVGTTSTSRISLTESYQKDAIVQKIDSMTTGSESAINIYNGLVEMRKLFSSSGRPSVTRLAILLLSNQDSTYNSLTQNEAQSAYLKDGIRLYVVGVGNAITYEQLKNISSPPNQAEENYWKLPDFQSLNNILHNLQLVSCNPGKVYYYSCEIMDVAFALPTSPDVSTWNYLKNFIEHFIDGFFSINAAGVRIGFITYNISNTVTHFRLEQYSSESQVMAAIDSLRFEFLNGVNDGNPTNALIAAKALFTPTRNVQKTLILFLDKELSSQEDAFNAASDLTVTLGVRIVTINIGSSNSFTNLRKIATRTQDILQITTYGYLQTAIGQLGDVVCGAQSDIVCPRKADVVLLVDQSTSIVSGNNGYANWDLVKNFAATIADAFPVSETLTRIGVILFSNNALVDSAINLNRYMNNAALKSAILSLELGGGETNIADGIRHVIPMFDQSVGGRSDAPHIMILITDGKANRDTENTLIEAQKAKAANITIFTIGVTNQIDEDQLRSIASSPSNEHYFFSNDFEKLSELLNKVIQKSCVNAVTIPTTTRRPTTTTTATTTTKISTTTTSITSASITIPTTSSSTLTPQITTDDLPSTTVATTSSSTTTTTLGSPYNTTTTATQSVISFIPPSEAIQCLEEIDIVFVLDQSIGNENWNQVKYFVSQIVQYLNISDNGIHVGLVTVGTTSTSRISLTESYQKDTIVQKIDSMPPGSESAINIYNGLVEMRKLFSSSGRPSVTRLAILLLSNQDSTYNSLTQNEAQSAYLKDGIRLYVVGVGNAITDEQLKNISSPPNQAEENYWKLPDFQSLNNILHNLQLVSCNPGKVYYYSCEIMDVAFALPTSPDVSTWNYLKNFIEHFIEGFFSINAAGVRIGFITYNISNTVTHFRLEQYSNESQVMATIDSLKFEFLNGVNDGNPTNALIAAKALFTPTRNVQKTLILFLDKELSSQEDAFKAASDLTVTLGVRIVTINIGSSNSFTNLRKIATRTQDILQIATYGYLQTAIGQLGDVVCGAQSDIVCPRKADVVLLVDQSTSIVSGNNGYANWDLVKNFAATIADAFPVSETLTRIGVILFSNNALVDSAINLNRYMNNAALKSAILSLELGGGETNIADGIRHVIPMFDQSVGGRSDAPHIMILITDGKANRDTENTLIEAQKAKAANITIFTIGVTNQIDEDQLKSIASSPSDEHYFFSNDFEKLSELLNKVIQKSCVNAVTIPTTTRRPPIRTTATTTTTRTPTISFTRATTVASTTTTPRTSSSSATSSVNINHVSTSSNGDTISIASTRRAPEPSTNCRYYADVVFVIHSSYNMRVDFFRNYLLKLIEDVASNFDVSLEKTKVAAISFSSSSSIDFYLNNYTTSENLVDAIKKISYGGYGTNLAAALSLARNSVFTSQNGARNSANVAKNVIVILNYKSDNDSAALVEAELLRKAGVNIFSVGSGTILNIYELAALSNFPFTKNMAIVSTARNLISLSDTIKQFSCRDNANCESTSCNGGQCLIYANQAQCYCPPGKGGQHCESNCNKGGDVVFAVDTSRGMVTNNYLDLVNVLTQVIQDLSINSDSPTTSRIGLLTYDGAGVKIYFQLNKYSSKLEILQSLNFYPTGGDKFGLLYALGNASDMFQLQNGDRPDFPNYLVLITSGDDYNKGYLYDVELWKKAVSLRQRGTKIIGVGLGDSSDYLKKLLVRLSSYGEKNVLVIPDVPTLLTRKNFVTDRLCSNVDYCAQNQCKSGSTCTSEIGTYKCGPCPLQTNGAMCDRTCYGDIDLAILLFSGGAVHRERFEILTNFAASLVENLDVSENRTRIALIFWANQAEIAFNLNSFQNKHDIVEAIKLIPYYMGGGNNISGALRLLRRNIFNQSAGDRPQARNIAVVVTNSPSNVDMNITIPEAIQNRIDGTFILPIALENQMKYSLELESIASHPRPFTVVKVPSFSELQGSVSTVINVMCKDANICQTTNCDCSEDLMTYSCTCPRPYYGRGCRQNCSNLRDVIFLIDISGSLEEEYRRNVLLAREITYGLPIEEDFFRIGAVAYSDNVVNQFYLDQHIRDKNAIINSFDFFPIGGRTNTAAGLDTILRYQINQRGDRSAVQNIIIIITDGQSNVNQEQTIPNAKALRDSGAILYVVATGDAPNMPEITDVASSPNLIFNYPFNSSSLQVASNIISTLCR